MTQILVSQNVPYNSPMDVTINDPVDNHIHCSQVLAMSFKWLQYLQSIFQAIIEMVPNLIWAPGFFGPQKIWSPRNLDHEKFGPRENWTPHEIAM